MKLSNGEVVVIDDLIPLQQQIRLYVEACTVPYQLSGSNKFDVQDIRTQKPVSYVDQKWVVENFFTDGVAGFIDAYVPPTVEKAYINCGLHSESPDVHCDSSRKGDKTLLYYMNREWKHEWGGETILLGDDAQEIEYITPYKPGRTVSYTHLTLPTNREV